MPAFALARFRTAITLGVLALLLLLGVAWGWGAVTEPFTTSEEVPVCRPTDIPAETKVYPDQVTVSVANAGTREGLAGRTMQLFTEGGFGQGGISNAPDGTDVPFAEIWTDDPDNPAVRLVKSYLGKRAKVVRTESGLPGVNVIVGDDFVELAQGRKAVQSDQDSEICSPPAEADADTGVVE
ncbi:LytR C-terminal domain-containing protein [Nocardioides sp. 503]|uniref:LytR C-terminal domain-containing protein n=1 Tax=Nocardioides sp. 503 TaxID=2508326 RepID=UPI0010701148|nr:LytR C-terminal domain-containing protein [Nocardioides sp. 503]